MNKVILLLKWDAFVVSLMSIIYGIQLIASPQLLNRYEAYKVIGYLFDSQSLGIAFVLLGLFKTLAIMRNNLKMKTLSISLLGGLWMYFFIGFALSPVANSLWALPLAMFLLCVGIAIKELTV
mgnify:CR=1 FL=1